MKRFALFAVFAAGSVVAQAQLYSQNPHTPGAAGSGSSSFSGNLGVPTTTFDRQIADDFTVGGGGWSINRVVTNWVLFTPTDPNPVTALNIRFFNGAGNIVGSLITTATVNSFTRTAGPGTYFTRPEQILDASIAPVVLGPGHYFVSIQPVVNHNWFWLSSSPTTPIADSPAQFQKGPGTSVGNDPTWPVVWTPSGPANPAATTAVDMAFQLHGSPVPEPATMIALGLGAVALIRRRRKSA